MVCNYTIIRFTSGDKKKLRSRTQFLEMTNFSFVISLSVFPYVHSKGACAQQRNYNKM